jgi:hypothetical protein
MAAQLPTHTDLFGGIREYRPSNSTDHVLKRLFGKNIIDNPDDLEYEHVGNINNVVIDKYEDLGWDVFDPDQRGHEGYGLIGHMLTDIYTRLERNNRLERIKATPQDVVRAFLGGMQINIINREEDEALPDGHPELGLPDPRLSIDIFRDEWYSGVEDIFNKINPAFCVGDINPNIPSPLDLLNALDKITPQQGNSFDTYLEVNWYGDIYANEDITLDNIDLLDVHGTIHGYRNGREPGAVVKLHSGILVVHDGEYQRERRNGYNTVFGDLFGKWEKTVTRRGYVESGVELVADKIDIRNFVPSNNRHWDKTSLKATKTDVVIKHAPNGIHNTDMNSVHGSVYLGFDRTDPEKERIIVGTGCNLFAADELHINGSLYDSTVKYPSKVREGDDGIDIVDIRGDVVRSTINDSFQIDANRIIGSTVELDTSVTIRNNPAYYMHQDVPENAAIYQSTITLTPTAQNDADAGDDQFIEVVHGDIHSSNINAPNARLVMTEIPGNDVGVGRANIPAQPQANPAEHQVLGNILNQMNDYKTINVHSLTAADLHGPMTINVEEGLSLIGTALGAANKPLLINTGGDIEIAGVTPLPVQGAEDAEADPRRYSAANVTINKIGEAPSIEITTTGGISNASIGTAAADNPAHINITIEHGNLEKTTVHTHGSVTLAEGEIVDCRGKSHEKKYSVNAADVKASGLNNSELHILRSAVIGTPQEIDDEDDDNPDAAPVLPEIMRGSIIRQHEGHAAFMANQPVPAPDAPPQLVGVQVHGHAVQSAIHTPEMDATIDGNFSVQGNWEHFARNRNGAITNGLSDSYAPIAARLFDVGGHVEGIVSTDANGTWVANASAHVGTFRANSLRGLVMDNLQSLELRGEGALLDTATITYATPVAIEETDPPAHILVEGSVSGLTLRPAQGVAAKPTITIEGLVNNSVLDCHDIHASDIRNTTLATTGDAYVTNIMTGSNVSAQNLYVGHVHGGHLKAVAGVHIRGEYDANLYTGHSTVLPVLQEQLAEDTVHLNAQEISVDSLEAAHLELPDGLLRLRFNNMVLPGALNAPQLALHGLNLPGDNAPYFRVASAHVASVDGVHTMDIMTQTPAGHPAGAPITEDSPWHLGDLTVGSEQGGQFTGGNVTGIARIAANNIRAGDLLGIAVVGDTPSSTVHAHNIAARAIQGVENIHARGDVLANELTSFTRLTAMQAQITGNMANRPGAKAYVITDELNAPHSTLTDSMVLLNGAQRTNHIERVVGSTVLHAPGIMQKLQEIGMNPEMLTMNFANLPKGTQAYNQLLDKLNVDDGNEEAFKAGLREQHGHGDIGAVNPLDIIRARMASAFDACEPVLPDDAFDVIEGDEVNYDQQTLVRIDHARALEHNNGLLPSHLVGHALELHDIDNSNINAHILSGELEPTAGDNQIEPLVYFTIAADDELEPDEEPKLSAFSERLDENALGQAGFVALKRRDGNHHHFHEPARLITEADMGDRVYLERAHILPPGAQMDDFDIVMLARNETIQLIHGEDEPGIIRA